MACPRSSVLSLAIETMLFVLSHRAIVWLYAGRTGFKTVLADSIYNILIFLLKKCEYLLESYLHFFSKNFQHICVLLDIHFNESLTNDIVSFEQLGPDYFALCCYDMNALFAYLFFLLVALLGYVLWLWHFLVIFPSLKNTWHDLLSDPPTYSVIVVLHLCMKDANKDR